MVVLLVIAKLSACLQFEGKLHLPESAVQEAKKIIKESASEWWDVKISECTPSCARCIKVKFLQRSGRCSISWTLESSKGERLNSGFSEFICSPSKLRGAVREIQFVREVKIDSEPEFADVWVDGRKVGRTPVTILTDKGKIEILVVKEGFRPVRTLFDTSRQVFVARLKELPRLFIKRGREIVYVNGKRVIGQWVYLERQTNIVRIKSECGEVVQKVEVVPGKDEYKIDVRQEFRLQVTSKPPKALVKVSNGKSLTLSSPIDVYLCRGKYRVRVEKENFYPYEKEIFLDSNTVMHVKLEPTEEYLESIKRGKLVSGILKVAGGLGILGGLGVSALWFFGDRTQTALLYSGIGAGVGGIVLLTVGFAIAPSEPWR